MVKSATSSFMKNNEIFLWTLLQKYKCSYGDKHVELNLFYLQYKEYKSAWISFVKQNRHDIPVVSDRDWEIIIEIIAIENVPLLSDFNAE